MFVAAACGPSISLEPGADTGSSGAGGSNADGEISTSSSGAHDGVPGSPVTTDAMTTSVPEPSTTGATGPAPGSTEDTAPGDTSDDGPVSCEPPCPLGQECIAGICFGEPSDTEAGGCPAWGESGNYEPCFDAGSDACDGGICITDDPRNPGFATCTALGCTDVCDCPDPGDLGGTLVCDVITADMQTGCFFTCGGGGECPPGMTCLAGFVCGWSQ